MSNRTTIFEQLYTALSGVPGLTGVFDGQAPADQAGPYLVIGQSQELRGRLIDDSERKMYVTLHIWSSYGGRAEIVKLCGLVESAMPPDYCFDDAQVMKDDASGWQHGVLTYRVYFERGN
ncbi:DUF3168 domain-containing protein [Pyramidobacter piscolens]|uniref:DUF3168 domain-containing protein n=1 Tax=Pyramidobacter piscolens TaxID=638849 RepID=UPI003AF94414